VENLKKKGIQVDVYFIKGKGIRGYLRNLKPLKKVIEAGAYDLVHAHYGLAGMLAVLQRKLPVIITFSGTDINYLKYNLLSSLAAMMSRRLIFVSSNLYRAILIKKKKHHIVPYGINPDIFKPLAQQEARRLLGLSPDAPYILFSSSFSFPVKNYALAQKVMRHMGNVKLLELAGYTQEQVNLLLNACNVLLLTSKSEGSPQIIKEALACNCPIVSTDVGDVRELIGTTAGCYITTQAPTDIAEKLQKALADGGRTRGREKIMHLAADKISDKILAIYGQVKK